VKEDEIGGTWYIYIYTGGIKERDHLQELDKAGRMIFKKTQRNRVKYFEMSETASVQRQVTGFCKHGDETLDFMKFGVSIDELRNH
jgi:hypothetical protein